MELTNLLPKPQKVEIFEGDRFYLTKETTILIGNSENIDLFYPAGLLQTEINEKLGYKLLIRKGMADAPKIILRMNPAEVAEKEGRQEEAYTLTVTKEQVEICGADDAGVLYGIQTLRQLIREYGPVLPCVKLWDAPEYRLRGFYHDVTRGRVPTLESLKKLADKLAFYKINQLQLYVEHTYMFQGMSELWRDNTPLTGEEILEFDRYCKNLHIDLVPSIASFGHLYHILSTKEYAHLCELEHSQEQPFSFFARMSHHTIDVSNPESEELIFRLLDEYGALFSSQYFNLCGDETFDLGKGRSRKLAEEIGEQKLYLGFVKKICEHLIVKGKTPMFWGDVIGNFPEAIKELPTQTICLNWGYDAGVSEDSTRALWSAGATQVLCPGVSGWNQFVNDYRNAYGNIVKMCGFAKKYGALGVLNTDWGDYGHISCPEFSIPGRMYGAEFSWNSEEISYEEINRRISKIEYGDSTGEFLAIVERLQPETKFSWFAAVVYKETKQGRLQGVDVTWAVQAMDAKRVEKAEHQIAELKKQLYGHLLQVDIQKRHTVYRYLLAADVISVFNRIGLFLHTGECANRKVLASELEQWYYDYKTVWRETCKESELYRIGEVVMYYADLLRDSLL